MEFLKTVKRKTFWSEATYYALNIGLVVILFIMARTIPLALIPISLVLLSKWRVLAVRPRYWWSNFQANLVDLIVGVSLVVLMYIPQISVAQQLGIAVLYAVWLLGVKPLSKKWQRTLQAGLAIFLGTSALFAVSYDWPSFPVVMLMMIIGYSAARHFLHDYDEEQIVLLSLVHGLLFAEVGWLAHYWTYGYALAGMAPFQIPQATIIVLLLSFLVEKVYLVWKKQDRQLSIGDIIGPVILVVALIIAMLLRFNSAVSI